MAHEPIFTLQALVIWTLILGSVAAYQMLDDTRSRPLTVTVESLQHRS